MGFIGKYLEIEPGLEIYYIDEGRGDPMVLVPGLTFSGEIFENQIRHFSKTKRVIAIDPRGQGRSSKTLLGHDYATHGRDLAQIIELLNLTNITLLGWSTGNLTVWSYAEQFGVDKIAKTITIDMSPKPLSADPSDWVECSLDDLCEVSTKVLTAQEGQRAFFTEYAETIMIQRKLLPEELFMIIGMSSRTPVQITHALFGNAVMGDYRPGCKLLNDKIPSMIFIAEHWADIAEPYMKKNYPNIKTHVMGGHMMFWEYADKFNAKLEEFLSDKK